jgi:F-box and WD-40 domain protein 1/11
MDPVQKLPPEITAEIFSYLDLTTLLTASLASRAWRDRIFDSRLWRELYIREGWRFDIDAVRKYEQLHSQSRKSRTRHADSDATEPQLKRRVTGAEFYSRSAEAPIQQASPPWNEQHDSVEADLPGSPHDAEGDREMHDVHADGHVSPPRGGRNGRNGLISSMPAPDLAKTASLLIRLPNGSAKINWPHLYKQRRRLEMNWLKGRFTNFQLPHPSQLADAHSEYVYTIQFSGRWLVSGSRDRTLRVWDLESRQMLYPPLFGHTKSVLCLQFDSSPSEDIIMSGSSDRNVILWRFSTGEKIQTLANAHKDSILNLKFDERFLVTCSKDKLIKIWSRQELTPLDKDYPSVFKGPAVKYPSYIIDTSDIPPSLLEAEIAKRHIQALAPYSLLMTLDGHGAAVNAIQINEDEIVSASGDRLIKVWNIHNGACLKTLMGHLKGIACVQLDSRRIVSGSNDNTVRIYDHVSGAEVACLKAHGNLVRTVQAGFSDPPGAEEALRLEALAVDSEYWDAHRAGDLPVIQHRSRRRRSATPRNTGSKDPKDVMALGAAIPPGGGGSAWGRIVSGSYDETVIVWRKDHIGQWGPGLRLRHEDAILSASATPMQRGQTMREAASLTNRAVPWAQGRHRPQHGAAVPPVEANAGDDNQDEGTSEPADPNQQPPPPPAPAAVNGLPANPLAVLQHANELNAHLQAQMQNHGAAHEHVHVAQPFNNPMQPMSRLFKLQFDARRIICASQDPRIVAWDFAYGDEEIIKASQFFTGV